MNELAEFLESEGHEVTIISACPGRGKVIRHAHNLSGIIAGFGIRASAKLASLKHTRS